MKVLSLLLWVTQFGVSTIFPLCFFLLLASWLQSKFGLGMWVTVVLGIIGLMTTVSTVKSCLHSLRKAADEASSKEPPPIAFNDHL
ncbi:MAG: AtpZ/AtpI family protein [Firmicutes bacterium]|nr:AtpZ/AtpI family protein [Bacillota bacterium]